MVLFLILIIFGFWKEWGEFVVFGIFLFVVVLVMFFFLDFFEKLWIFLVGVGIIFVVLYSVLGMGIRLNYFIKRVERLVWVIILFIVLFIICVMVWGGIFVVV